MAPTLGIDLPKPLSFLIIFLVDLVIAQISQQAKKKKKMNGMVINKSTKSLIKVRVTILVKATEFEYIV